MIKSSPSEFSDPNKGLNYEKNRIGCTLSNCQRRLAHNCPNEMKAIDAKMSMANLSPADTTKVKVLREEGEKQHKAGNHGESMKALGEAKKILGI